MLRGKQLPEKSDAEHDRQHHRSNAGREDRRHRGQPQAPAFESCTDECRQQRYDTTGCEQGQHAAEEGGNERARVDERVHETLARRRRTPPSEIRP